MCNTFKGKRALVTVALVGAALVLAAGCSSDSTEGTADQGTADARADAGSGDTTPGPDTRRDTAAPDASASDSAESEIQNDFGFAIRTPRTRTIECPEPSFGKEDRIEATDMDWVCTFDHAGTQGHVYIQGTPVACKSFGMSTAAEFEGAGFISVDGTVTPVAGAWYDWGGNHHNDSLGFTHGGKHYRYYHSSFGFGWRACHPMDCMQVLQAPNGAVVDDVDDGCTPERTLPVVCLQVEAGRGYGAGDFVDTFAKCPGDED